MSVTVERSPDEPIFIATFGHPFDAHQDVKGMFSAFTPMRSGIKGSLVLILDLSVTDQDPHAFSQMVIGLGEAAAQIRVNKTDQNMSPPHIIFIGSGNTVPLAAAAMEQAQYGSVKVRACTRRDEAVSLARSLLSK